MSIKILSRIRNRFNPVRSYSNGRLTIPPLVFVLYILLASVNTSLINGNIIDWSILSSDDTLTLYLKDVRVGMLYSNISIDSLNRVIKMSVNVNISSDISDVSGSFSGVNIYEMRKYDFNGQQISALQRMNSPSGTALWKLDKKDSDKWQLTVSAGGMENVTFISDVGGNLKATYLMQKGIDDRNIKVGQEWKDTLLELTSAKNMIITTKCTAVPDKENPNYVFISHDGLTGMETKQEMDINGRVVLEEVPPIFVAKRYSADDKGDSGKAQPKTKIDYLYELVNIPIDRAQKSNETIALTIKQGTKLHGSVMRFYDFKDNKYVIKKLNKKCHTKNLSIRKEDLKGWLSSTVTIQSGNPEIKNLAMTLKGTRTCRCEISKIYCDYLFKNIEKKHVATFSNAYETLKAGYGDCGEHAVLLTALLRSVGIESNVVLGLVYISDKKGYYYHAWVVAYIKDLVLIDPALNVVPAIYGYIPLILDDDGTNMVYLAGLIGKVDISYVPK